MTHPKTVAANLIKRHGKNAYSVAWRTLENSVGQSNREFWASVCNWILIAQDGNYARKNTNR